MGFLSNLVKRRSEIGRPGPSIGVRPMLREPTLDIRGERSIFGQPSPFGPPIPPQPPVPQVRSPFVPPSPIQPPIAPPPVNIGGPPLDTSLIPQREILERPIIPPRRGIIGSNPIIESGTGGIGARPDLPQLPRSSAFGGKGMRDDFMSIERLDDPIMQSLPVGPSIPFVPPPQPPVTLPVSPVQARRQELENLGYDAADVQEILERDQQRGLENVTSNVLPQIISKTPLVIPPRPPQLPPKRSDQLFIDDRPRDPRLDRERGVPIGGNVPGGGGIDYGGPQQSIPLIPKREILQKPIIPPRRDDFMSIERIDEDPRIPSIINEDPVVTPTTTTVDTPVTTIPEDPRGQVDPVLAQQDAREIQTDPLLRALYFGTADQPGYINQLQQATANLIGSDVPLQQTAGLSELEQMAQDRAIADLGVAEPFVGERADLLRGTTRQFDPSMTQQFFNPYEDRVVQQTIQDVLEAGEKRDIAQRAQDIKSGGLSAFGSRARLTSADRQEALGRGLAEALGGIRQAGFSEAQRSALSTFDRQRLAEQQAATGIGQVGTQLADLRERERAGLAGFGQVGRGIDETGLSRLFQQQVDAQGRPLQALQVTGQLLPQFQAGSTQIDSQYRLPTDPSAAGLGAAFSAYSALAPKQGTA